MRQLAMFVWTAGYSGLVPIAPGTAGSVVGLALALSARLLNQLWVEPVLILVVVAGGVWSASKAEDYYGRKDPGEVVIDEVAGMMLTVFWLPSGWVPFVIGFLAFRFFDIVKPFPARMSERLPGGFGVMADDLVAGLYGYATVRTALWLLPVGVT